jgi:oxysterol-binding protein-related protein 3/6/7
MLNPRNYTQSPITVSMATAQPHAVIEGMHQGESTVMEGWVLKKRRKKMQGASEWTFTYSISFVLKPRRHRAGFARRYFVLSQSGILSYSFGPGLPARDHIVLPHAAITTSPGRKDIHVDSSNATFHIKCLSVQDFNSWMAAFR